MNQSDFQEILKLCKETGGRYIFVESGKPSFVLMNIEEYKKIFQEKGKDIQKNYQRFTNLSKEELVERINKEIATWRESQKEREVENILSKEEKPADEKNYHYDIEDKLDFEK